MKLHKLYLLTAFALVAFGLPSCYSDPEFDVVPSIEFRDVEQYTKVNNTNALYDSLVLVVRFQDGDGDLGLSATDPADLEGENAPGQPFYHNFIVNVSKKENGSFQPILVGGVPINYNGRFPRVSTTGREEPLEGDIRFSLNIFQNNALRRNDTIQFKVQIADRANHLSNVVSTSEVVMFSK